MFKKNTRRYSDGGLTWRLGSSAEQPWGLQQIPTASSRGWLAQPNKPMSHNRYAAAALKSKPSHAPPASFSTRRRPRCDSDYDLAAATATTAARSSGDSGNDGNYDLAATTMNVTASFPLPLPPPFLLCLLPLLSHSSPSSLSSSQLPQVEFLLPSRFLLLYPRAPFSISPSSPCLTPPWTA